ncbi:MAG: succinate dehydrogenase, cytochrome b556 subunit [Alphaproteobacteria bacterium]|nr:succinate dehydrogenase, cytochrome b556 subunit [Alphaproteobacteria bacterium]
MAHIERPISPHLQIYKPQISSVLSILHRITGAALGFGLLLFAWWLIAAASGPEAYACASGFIGSVLGRLILFGFTWALFYHFCNGIRHLFWDMGKGFELPVMHRTGWAVVAGSAALTILVWVLAYALR